MRGRRGRLKRRARSAAWPSEHINPCVVRYSVVHLLFVYIYHKALPMQAALAGSRYKQRWVQIHSSLWFLPACVTIGLMLMAPGLIELDRHVDTALQQRWPRLFTVAADGARNLLAVIAGSMATIAGVTFSITMVALTLASAQYSPRVLRNFMRDKVTQLVLGIFVGIFLYCLLVLLAIREEPDPFVPACAVLGAVALSVLACGAFIFFIHHISSSIQAAEMARAITHETLDMIDKYFPNDVVEGGARKHEPRVEAASWHRVPALHWGTIQTVTETSLLAWACTHDAIVRMEHKPGQFIGIGETLVSVAVDRPLDDGAITALNGAYGMGAFRTLDQDPTFGVRQLVDMALKALSPGINDSTTAVTCLEHIAVILACCARRDLQSRNLYDDDGQVRVLTIGIDFAHLSKLAFSQVSESAQGNTEVLLRIFDAIGKIGRTCQGSLACDALLSQAEITGDIALHSAKTQDASERLGARMRELRHMLSERGQVAS